MNIEIKKNLTNVTELLDELWEGGYDTAKGIIDNGDEDVLYDLIESRFPNGGTIQDVNDLLWFTEDQEWIDMGVSYYLEMNFPENTPMSLEKMVNKLENNGVFAQFFDGEQEEEQEEYDLVSIENKQLVTTCNISYNKVTNEYTLNFE